MSEAQPGAADWADAALAASLIAVDPAALGGVVVSALAGPVRDRWLQELRHLCRNTGRFLPHADDTALVGGLDLAATLSSGRPQVRRGLLAEYDGGCLIVPMAERLSATQAGMIAAALDQGAVNLQRDGFSCSWPARLGVVLLNETFEPDDACSAALLERCAFHLDLSQVSVRDLSALPCGPAAVAAARRRLAGVSVPDALLEALCRSAVELGIGSLRAPLLARRAAVAAAALLGEQQVSPAQARLAVRLVYAPRSGEIQQPQAPSQEQDESSAAAAPEEPPPSESGEDEGEASADDLAEMMVATVRGMAKLPLQVGNRSIRLVAAGGPGGRAGPAFLSTTRGRPHGARPGTPGSGARLDLLATLRAAAPWQRLRGGKPGADTAIAIHKSDLQVRRYRQRAATLTIFLVDASGSAALQRLGEAKGAVELLLADCYVRRDSVALITFRGQEAQMLLPPTRSLVRAKRCLAHLAGGGGTPLPAGLDAAASLAARSQRRGMVPAVVVLTDGRGNISRAGHADRRLAAEESLSAARRLRAMELGAMVVDVSPRGQAAARELAQAAGGSYMRLPQADARHLSSAVQSMTGMGSGRAA